MTQTLDKRAAHAAAVRAARARARERESVPVPALSVVSYFIAPPPDVDASKYACRTYRHLTTDQHEQYED